LDSLHEALHQSVAELKDGQNRIERETHKRLDRIETQTKAHNGRMTKLEEQHIHDETLREERERVALNTAASRTWTPGRGGSGYSRRHSGHLVRPRDPLATLSPPDASST
jgi:hypothetical protein